MERIEALEDSSGGEIINIPKTETPQPNGTWTQEYKLSQNKMPKKMMWWFAGGCETQPDHYPVPYDTYDYCNEAKNGDYVLKITRSTTDGGKPWSGTTEFKFSPGKLTVKYSAQTVWNRGRYGFKGFIMVYY